MQNSMVIFVFSVVFIDPKIQDIHFNTRCVTHSWVPNRCPPPHPHPLINFSIFFPQNIPEHSFSTPSPCLLIIGEVFQPEFETIYLCILFCNLAKGVTSLQCVSFCKFEQRRKHSVLFCKLVWQTFDCFCKHYCHFCRSSRMFVDVFIECAAWS